MQVNYTHFKKSWKEYPLSQTVNQLSVHAGLTLYQTLELCMPTSRLIFSRKLRNKSIARLNFFKLWSSSWPWIYGKNFLLFCFLAPDKLQLHWNEKERELVSTDGMITTKTLKDSSDKCLCADIKAGNTRLYYWLYRWTFYNWALGWAKITTFKLNNGSNDSERSR